MYYITMKQSPMYRQMSIEEFLFGTENKSILINKNETNTRTYTADRLGKKLTLPASTICHFITVLTNFVNKYEYLYNEDRKNLYKTFYIPKKSGGLRRIDAPKDELMKALRELKDILEDEFGVLYHTAAFAYVKGRSVLDAVKRHQANESKWFGKFDLHNFFGSTTLEFVMNQFKMVYPFCQFCMYISGDRLLEKALSLAFLDGVLPQGTPISPLITNVMMIPIDYKLANTLRNFDKNKFVYTRYADDFIISAQYDFKIANVQKLITETLEEFHAPFALNTSKTRYGSSAGRNWNLGLMLNKDNEITVGHKAKRRFQAMLNSYILDRQNGNPWNLEDIQTLEGYRSYYTMVEGERIEQIITHMNEKYKVDVKAMIKEDLK